MSTDIDTQETRTDVPTDAPASDTATEHPVEVTAADPNAQYKATRRYLLDMRLLRAVMHHAGTDAARPALHGVQLFTEPTETEYTWRVIGYAATDSYTLATAAPADKVEWFRDAIQGDLSASRVFVPTSVVKVAKPLGAGLATLEMTSRDGQNQGRGMLDYMWRGEFGEVAAALDSGDYYLSPPEFRGLFCTLQAPLGDKVIALNADYLSRWADSALEMVKHVKPKSRVAPPVRLICQQGVTANPPIRVEMIGEVGTVIGLHMPVRIPS